LLEKETKHFNKSV